MTPISSSAAESSPFTLEWKRLLGREKDRADIAAPESWST
jgi:hypothetical protein